MPESSDLEKQSFAKPRQANKQSNQGNAGAPTQPPEHSWGLKMASAPPSGEADADDAHS